MYDRRRKNAREQQRTRWWKIKSVGLTENFREDVMSALGGREELPNDWVTTATLVRESARKVQGVASGQMKEDKDT